MSEFCGNTTDTLAFIARGREYRSEFHINPSDETMYMIKGEMRLHYRTPEGKEEIAVIAEGAMIYTPAGTPHSPRFPPDAFALISERKRRAGEIDRFHWYCQKCDNLLHEESFVVHDYAEDRCQKPTTGSLRVWSSEPVSSVAESCRPRMRSDFRIERRTR